MLFSKQVRSNLHELKRYPGLVLPRQTIEGPFTKEQEARAIEAYQLTDTSDRTSTNRKHIFDVYEFTKKDLLSGYIGLFQNRHLNFPTLKTAWIISNNNPDLIHNKNVVHLIEELFTTQIAWSNEVLELMTGRLKHYLNPNKKEKWEREKSVQNAFAATGNYQNWGPENCHILAPLLVNKQAANSYRNNQRVEKDVKELTDLLAGYQKLNTFGDR